MKAIKIPRSLCRDGLVALFPSDKLLLKFVEKHHTSDINARRITPAFDQLISDVLASYMDPLNKRLGVYIDVGIWVDSKVQRKPVIETVSPPTF